MRQHLKPFIACCSLALVSILSGEAKAADPINYGIYQTYVSPRALGMGNAFIALADDYNALFYNPAGLAKMEEGQLNLKLGLGVSPTWFTLMKDIQDASGGTKTDAQKTADMVNLVAKQYGTNYWSRLPGLGGIWTRPGWGVGVLLPDANIDLGFQQGLGPQAIVEAYADTQIAFGYAKKFMDDALSAGVTAKAVYRMYAGKVVPAAELASNSNYFTGADAKEGMTFDFDLGAIYDLKSDSGVISWMKPSFGAVVRNVIDYGFKSNMHLIDKKSEEPPKLGRRLDLGTKLELPKFWVFSPRYLLDVKDIGHQYFTMKKGLHTGFELNWDAFSWLRGGWRLGMNQGYFAFGFSAQLVWFRLDLATWGEELGTTSAPAENRRYMVQMSLDF